MKTYSKDKTYKVDINLTTDYACLVVGKVSPTGIEYHIAPNWLGKLLFLFLRIKQ